MKYLNLMTALFLSIAAAHAAETSVLKCGHDARPIDGALNEFEIREISPGTYSFLLKRTNAPLHGAAFAIQTWTDAALCSFSTGAPGVGECAQTSVPMAGARGPLYLKTERSFSRGKDWLRVTAYVLNIIGEEEEIQSMEFEGSDCGL